MRRAGCRSRPVASSTPRWGRAPTCSACRWAPVPLGWKLINFRADPAGGSDAAGKPLNEVGTACTDANKNGKCDLSELLAACNSAGITTSVLEDSSVYGAQALTLGLLVSQVRGHCATQPPPSPARPSWRPRTDMRQRAADQPGRPGGIDHSAPAIVGPSPFISASPWSTRPIVAYAAGHDGMLHAFFVSAHDGSSTAELERGGQVAPGWRRARTGAVGLHPAGAGCGSRPTTRSWTLNINVVDVFGDFPYDANNDGVIDWDEHHREARPPAPVAHRPHRDGRPGRLGGLRARRDEPAEAHPALALRRPDRPGRPLGYERRRVLGAGERFDSAGLPADPRSSRSSGTTGTTVTPRLITSPPTSTRFDADVLDELKTGRYDYRNLGESFSTAIAKRWDGSSYQYVMYVATSAADYTSQPGATTKTEPAGYRGAEVFAIDVVTGQKVWQWEHFYSQLDGTGSGQQHPAAHGARRFSTPTARSIESTWVTWRGTCGSCPPATVAT